MKNRWVFLACLGSFAIAGQNPNTAEVSTRDAQTTFSTRVNLVMVPVVIRDKQGRAVGTLTKDDFLLSDKGKPQFIARFSVEKAAEQLKVKPIAAVDGTEESAGAPVAVANRFTAYLFDDMHIEFGDLVRSRDAVGRRIDRMESSERAAIYTTSGQVMQDFTDDRDALHATLAKLMPHVNPQRSICPPMTDYEADLINHNDPTALNAATDDTMACMHLDPSQRPVAVNVAQSAAQQTAAVASADTQITIATITDMVRRMGTMPGLRNLILVSDGFLVTQEWRQNESDLIDRAIRNNVRVNSLDARGLYTVGTDANRNDFSGSVASSIAKSMFERQSATADADVLAEVAYGTGGRFFQNSNDYDEGVRKLSELPEFVYILGFSPQNLKFDGQFHSLKVSLKLKNGYTVDARRGYYAPKHVLDAAEQAREEISEALFSRDEMQDIPVQLQTQFFKPAADEAKLAIVVKIDLKALQFKKEDGRNRNDLAIVSGIFDRNGVLVNALQKNVEMRLKEETLELRLAAGLTVKTSFDVIPGSYVIRLVVRDKEGQLMTARNGVVQIP